MKISKLIAVFGLWGMLLPPLFAETGLYFAEPYTGQRVEHYQVTLVLDDGKQKLFSLPQECTVLSQRLNSNGLRWAGVVEQRLLEKLRIDCSYFQLVTANTEPVQYDYVSQYDYKNALVSDFPFIKDCLTDALLCVPAHEMGTGRLMGMLDGMRRRISSVMHDVEAIACRFKNGVFRGWLYQTSNGEWLCRTMKHAPGFRLLSADVANVDGDDYQDMVLRLLPLGRGSGHFPVVFPVTRKSEQGVFELLMKKRVVQAHGR